MVLQPGVDYEAERRLWLVVAYDNPVGDSLVRRAFLTAITPLLAAAGGAVVAEACYDGVEQLPELPCTQLRVPCLDVLWQQERLLNLAIAAVPSHVDYIGWVSAGTRFVDLAWMRRAVSALEFGAGAVEVGDEWRPHERGAGCPVCHVCEEFGWVAPAELLREHGLYDRSLTGANSQLITHAFHGLAEGGCVTARLGHGTPAHRDFLAWAQPFADLKVSHFDAGRTILARRARHHRDANEALLAAQQLRFDPWTDLALSSDGAWEWPPARDDLRAWSTANFLDNPLPASDVSAVPSRLLAAGRKAADGEDWEAAAAHFEESLSCLHASPAAHLELVAAMDSLDAGEWLLVAELECYLADAPRHPGPTGLDGLAELADRLFASGAPQAAALLYGKVLRHRPTDDRVRHLLAEWHLEQDDPHAAMATLAGAPGTPSPDAAQAQLWARALLGTGSPEAARSVLEAAAASEPPDLETLRVLVDVHAALRRTDDPTELTKAAEHLSEIDRFEIGLRVAVTRRDLVAIEALYADPTDGQVEIGDVVLAQYVRHMTTERDLEVIEVLMAATGRQRSANPDLLLSLVDAALGLGEWDRASELLEQAEQVWQEPVDDALQVRRLYLDCFRLDVDAADVRLAAWDVLPMEAVPVVVALYATQGRWEAILELLAEQVEAGVSITHTLLFDTLMKAARQTGRYTDALALLDESAGVWPSQQLDMFRDQLRADMAMAAAVRDPAPHTLDAVDVGTPVVERRLSVLSRVLADPVQYDGPRTIYLCSDGGYLQGTLVALFSMLRNNPGLRQDTEIHLVISDDACSLASAVVGSINEAFGSAVSVLAASTVMSGSESLRTTWGLFSPGNKLSEAAYYRVFMAMHLVAEGRGGRALYVDSDTVIGGRVAELMNRDLRQQPLAARPELRLPEIVVAARRLEVPIGSYFNSGVLLFDLDHPELADSLARTMDFAVNKPELLTFVDQCALNIGFQDRMTPLPPECNYFIRQEDRVSADLDPTVLHYLTRPKPWETTYRSPHCLRWLAEFKLLGQVARPDDVRAVLARYGV